MAEALQSFVPPEKARASVLLGEVAQFKEVHKIVLPSFNKLLHKEAVVTEGEEVMFLRPEERGTQQLNTSKIPIEQWGPPLIKEDWVVLCQAQNQSIKEEEWVEMHGKLGGVSKEIEVKTAGQRAAVLGKMACRKTLKESFFSATVEAKRAFPVTQVNHFLRKFFRIAQCATVLDCHNKCKDNTAHVYFLTMKAV